MKYAILYLFSYGGVDERTVDSVVRELYMHPGEMFYSRISGDALISRSRSRAASQFLSMKSKDGETPDVVLMVDHDLEWNPGAAWDICQKAVELDAIVGGMYCKRTKNQGWSSRPEGGSYQIELGTDEVRPAVYVATGFMAIPRTVLVRMIDKLKMEECTDGAAYTYYPLFMPLITPHTLIPDRYEYLSEDWAFCQRAKSVGEKVWLYYKPILVHWGDHGYTVKDGEFVIPPGAGVAAIEGPERQVPSLPESTGDSTGADGSAG